MIVQFKDYAVEPPVLDLGSEDLHQFYVPSWLPRITRLKNAVLVYAILLYHRGQEEETCRPGVTRIAALAGLGYKTTQRALKKLRDIGLIRIDESTGPHVANVYHFLTHPAMKKDLPEDWSEECIPLGQQFKGSIGVPVFLSRRSEVSHHGKLIYGLILHKAVDGICWGISREEVSRVLGCEMTTYKRARADLEKHGLIQAKIVDGHSPNVFTLLDHPWVREKTEDVRANPGRKSLINEKRGGAKFDRGGAKFDRGGAKLRRQEYLKNTEEFKTSKSPLGKETSFSTALPGKGIQLGPPDGSMGDTPGEPIGEDQGEPEIDAREILKDKVRPSKVKDIDPGSKRITNHNQRIRTIWTDPEYYEMLKHFPGFNLEQNVNSARLWVRRRLNGIICSGDMEMIKTYFMSQFYQKADDDIPNPKDVHDLLVRFKKIKTRALVVLQACVEDKYDYTDTSTEGENIDGGSKFTIPADMDDFTKVVREWKGQFVTRTMNHHVIDANWAGKMAFFGVMFEGNLSEATRVLNEEEGRNHHQTYIARMLNNDLHLAVAMEEFFPGFAEFAGYSYDEVLQRIDDGWTLEPFSEPHTDALDRYNKQTRTTLYGQPR